MKTWRENSGTCGEIEGALRGQDRELTQSEVVRLLKKELDETISQAYLSQIESGARAALD